MAIIPRSGRVPSSQPVLLGDTRIAAQAWLQWFQEVGDQLQRLVPSWRAGQTAVYANDAAAAAGGVVLGGLYFNGVQIVARLT